MSIRASIYHLTHYLYDRSVTVGPQFIRLRPAPHSRTKILSFSLEVNPQPHFLNHQQDPYGNWLARYFFPDSVRELKIEVQLTADLTATTPSISSSKKRLWSGLSLTQLNLPMIYKFICAKREVALY